MACSVGLGRITAADDAFGPKPVFPVVAVLASALHEKLIGQLFDFLLGAVFAGRARVFFGAAGRDFCHAEFLLKVAAILSKRGPKIKLPRKRPSDGRFRRTRARTPPARRRRR